MTHAFEEHTGEVKLRVTAETPEELFAEAARGLAALMVGEPVPPPPEGAAEVRLTVQARDRDALLVAWLDELIGRSEVEKRVFTDVHVERAGEREVHAVVRGVEPRTLRTAVKAATLHGLHVARTASGWSASVVLDV